MKKGNALISSLFCSTTGTIKAYLLLVSLAEYVVFLVKSSLLLIFFGLTKRQDRIFHRNNMSFLKSFSARMASLLHNLIPALELMCAIAFVAISPIHPIFSIPIAFLSCVATCYILHCINIRRCDDIQLNPHYTGDALYESLSPDCLKITEFEYTGDNPISSYFVWNNYTKSKTHNMFLSDENHKISNITSILTRPMVLLLHLLNRFKYMFQYFHFPEHAPSDLDSEICPCASSQPLVESVSSVTELSTCCGETRL
ncbi:MAG: hypothetical protein P857_901 [Candidatus Xenolissoclinum pacificiensis L6]|uniref:Uncharacterized protein n=1 Tax=Candidatus Xenolissoclinum pacificiensis L6 TaxID=1401685 RepID=W2V0H7_9RICK|nr:MAG: hypothetical protein P857_901 [Candidatus Xenolissoclinum pacificiensis L6]